MEQHVLLKHSSRYKEPHSFPTPTGCTYNSKKGYWVENDTGKLMMHSNAFRRINSKKCDRETGEDQKGE